MYNQANAKKTSGFSIFEMLCVVALLAVVMQVVTPLLRNAMGRLPAMQQAAAQRSSVISIVDQVREVVEKSDSINILADGLEMHSAEGLYQLKADDRLLTMFLVGDDNSRKRIFERETSRVHVDFIAFDIPVERCSAVNIRISDIASRKPELELERPLNFLFYTTGDLNDEKK